MKKPVPSYLYVDLAFLFCGFLRIVLYPYVILNIYQFLYISLTLIWAMSIPVRITDKRLRFYLVTIGILLVILFNLQLFKYRYCNSKEMLKLLWYMYYIPFCLIPFCMFMLALYIGKKDNETISFISKALIPIPFIVILCVFTNDYHNLFFVIYDIKKADISYSYGILFYVYVFCQALFTIGSLCIIFSKCRLMSAKKKTWIPVIQLMSGVILILLYVTQHHVYINGIKVWQIHEISAFTILAYLEACIYIGLIPSNREYLQLFSVIPVPVEIYDSKGNIVIHTRKSLSPGPNVLIRSSPIPGGTVRYATDTAAIDILNAKLAETITIIQTRNELLDNEIQQHEKLVEISAKNQIYDNIHKSVRKQLDSIEVTLKDNTKGQDQLSKIAFYTVYIKRRSNMELLLGLSQSMPVQELLLAIRESCEYLKLRGVLTIVNSTGVSDTDGRVLICAFEMYEAIIEQCLDDITALAVWIYNNQSGLVLRIMAKTDILLDNLDCRIFNYPEISKEFSHIRQHDESVFLLKLGGASHEISM